VIFNIISVCILWEQEFYPQQFIKINYIFYLERKISLQIHLVDFGGGTESSESYLNTAIREAGEELTGFLGTPEEIKKMLTKYGTYNIDYNTGSHSSYRMHIFPMRYTEELPLYYNNNQQFLQKHLDENVIKKTKIFEKAEIQWIPAKKLINIKEEFRSYFQNIVTILVEQQDKIADFVHNALDRSSKTLSLTNIYTMGSKKGSSSKTHPGRKNYTTKKGDKVFHRKGKYVRLSRKPYSGRTRKMRRH
jgi:transcription termination factor NusB